MKLYDSQWLPLRLDMAVVGIGKMGQQAVQRFKAIPHSLEYTRTLYLCDDVHPKARGQIFDAVAKCPVLFVLADIGEEVSRNILADCVRIHTKTHGTDGLAICAVYRRQTCFVTQELIDCCDNWIFVDDRLESLDFPVETLFSNMFCGMIGMELADIISVLRSCGPMHYFRRTYKDYEHAGGLEDLKRDILTGCSGHPSLFKNRIISIRMGQNYGLDEVERVASEFRDDGICIQQGVYYPNVSERSFEVSLVVGKPHC